PMTPTMYAISGLTITGGNGAGNNAGAVGHAGNSILSLDHVVISQNKNIVSNGGAAFALGGGITDSGTLHITDSTVSGNTASATTSATNNSATALGGGIFVNEDATLTLTRSTVSGNTATATNDTLSPPGSLNSADGEGGGVFVFSPTAGGA